MRSLLSFRRKDLPSNHLRHNLADLLPIGLWKQLPELIQRDVACPLFSGHNPLSYYEGRNEQRNNVRRFLKRVDDGAFTPLTDIESIAFDVELEDGVKVQRIQTVFATAKEKRETATENLAGLQTQLEPHAADAEYYRALESRSLKLQNRVSEIVKAVEFLGGNDSLVQAINH